MAEGLIPGSPPCYSWILEFLLRSLPQKDLANKISIALPLDSSMPHRLTKALHIRRLASGAISEHALASFEILHQYNLDAGAYAAHPSLLALIQSAYLHALVGSTLRPLANGDLQDFFDAVHHIWMVRVEDLLGSYAKDLASEELVVWKGKMEAASAAGNAEVRDRVLMEWKEEDGLLAVREYLVKELEVLGMPVLEPLSDKNLDGGGDCTMVGNEDEDADENDDSVVIDRGESSGGVGKSMDGIDCGKCVLLEEEGEEESPGEGDGDLNRTENGDDRVEVEGGGSDGLEEVEGMTDGQREPAGSGGRPTRSDFAHFSVPTPVVNRVKDDLKRSCQDLHNIVEDPLPNAKKAASRVIASRVQEVTYLEKPSESHSLKKPEQSQNAVDVNLSAHVGSTVSGGVNGDVELNKNTTKVPDRILRDRKRIAEPCEWEDESLESGSDDEASPAQKNRLSSPRIGRFSPLKPVKFNYTRRRRRRKWSVEQEDALVAGVSKHGAGNWQMILKDNPGAFEERTTGDLKDKWRNMHKD